MVLKNKKEPFYFIACSAMYLILNFSLTQIFNIPFNTYGNGYKKIGAYQILRLIEIIFVTTLCFLKKFKSFKFLIYFDICLIISWITDIFINFYFIDRSISIVFLLIATIFVVKYIVEFFSYLLNKINFYKKYKPYILMTSFFLIYMLLFAINLSLPVEYKILTNTASYNSRMWMMGNLSLIILAIYYIFKIKISNWLDLLISVTLGILSFVLSKDPLGSFENMVCYYASCGLFKQSSHEQKLHNFKFNKIIGSLGFGVLIGIPLGIINTLGTDRLGIFNLQVWNLHNIWHCLINSSGAVSEEITYHFFPLAIITYWFNGKIPKGYKSQIAIYIFLIIPHAINHIANLFVINPSLAIMECLKESIIFGIPFIWLMTNKGILSNSVCHTIVVLFYRMCGNIYTN